MQPSEPEVARSLLEHQAFLQRLARALVGRDADDLVQDVWQRALEHPPRHPLRLRAWIAQIARNLAANRRRAEMRRHEREAGGARSRSETHDPRGLEARFELQRAVLSLLDELEEPYRSTLLLRYFDGLDPEEIGRRAGVPIATVRTRLRRGLERLRNALDRKHSGGREEWMPVVVALAGRPIVGAVLTGTSGAVVGGIAMTKAWMGAAALVALVGAVFVVREVREVRPALATPGVDEVHVSDSGSPAKSEAPASDASAVRDERSLVAQTEFAAPIESRKSKHVLRGELLGLSSREALETRIEVLGVDTRYTLDEQKKVFVHANDEGSFELGLDDVFETWTQRSSMHIDELLVRVDHPLHMPESVRLTLSSGREQPDGRILYEVSIRLELAGVVRGTLLHDDGSPADHALVGAFRMAGDVPENVECRAVACDSSGAFAVRSVSAGSHVLVGHEDGYRPLTLPVAVLVGSVIDVGTLYIDRGLRISGSVQSGAMSLSEVNVCISLRIPGEARRMIGAADSKDLAWLDGRFEAVLVARVHSGSDGTFEFDGLGPHEYSLLACGLRAARMSMGGSKPGLQVQAPKEGVVLDVGFSVVRLEMTGDVARDAEGLLTFGLAGEAGHPVPLLGRERTFVATTPAETHLTGEITFPGKQPFGLDLLTLQAGQELVVPVHLVDLEGVGKVVLELDAQGVDLPAQLFVSLSRGGDFARPEQKAVSEGRIVLDGLAPGPYRVRVSAGLPGNRVSTLIRESELELELHAGEELRRPLLLRVGAGLRLTVRDEDGVLVGGSYALLDATGAKTELAMMIQTERGDVYGTIWQLLPYGTHESTSPLEPGRYELVLTCEGFQEERIPLTLTAGQWAERQVTLRR